MDKTPQIAEEQLIMTMDKAQETKLQVSVSVFSADISKSEEISRWQLIDKALHYDFTATTCKKFFKNCHNCSSERLAFFQQWVQQEAKQSILQDYEVTHRHTNTHTHTHTHTHTN